MKAGSQMGALFLGTKVNKSTVSLRTGTCIFMCFVI